MYDGWYCSFIENGFLDGLHAPTYKELLRRCKISGITLKGANRIDHWYHKLSYRHNGVKEVNMYYVYFKTKGGKKETAYSCSKNLIGLKFDIECIYRYSKIYKLIK